MSNRDPFGSATSWFDENPEKYLARDDFKEFQEASGVDFRELLADDMSRVGRAQKKLAEQSLIWQEIRKQHFGFKFPLFVYTQAFELFPPRI
jgi:hypothetical protein